MRYIALVLALGFLALSAPVAAQQRHQVFTHKLFKVSRCDAKQNLSASYPAYAGYVPGFYPYARPYYWGDPYGYGFYQPPITTSSPTMYVDFTNITNKVMKTVVWGLVANGRLVAEAKDVGTFSPGAEIKHKYGISENVFPLQTGLPQCIALAVTFEDGTHIRNPNLPNERRQMYESPPPGAGPPASPLP
ncbi:MAG: hypothetical protein WA629_01980 [Candidatus Aquilonibacter sp.]